MPDAGSGSPATEPDGLSSIDSSAYAIRIGIHNYPWASKVDPIPSWTNRLSSLGQEKDFHAVLKKYCHFMTQTEDLRETLSESAPHLDAPLSIWSTWLEQSKFKQKP